MAFEAKKQGFYWANIQKPIFFEIDWVISDITDWVDNDANEMHEVVVEELNARII